MDYLFHQNMKVFGGGSRPRNAAYNAAAGPAGAFTLLGGGGAGGYGFTPLVPAPPNRAAVLGFTEITNNRSSRAALTTSCQRLGANFIGNVACGITALARGPEYIGLGHNAAYALVGVGRILFQTGGGVTLLHQRAPTTAALNGLGWPAGTAADFRGLVYALVMQPGGGGNVIAVGFLHNLYSFMSERILVAGKIGAMMNTMGTAANGQAAVVPVARYMGGDFNVLPIFPRSGFTGYSALPPAYPAGAVAGGTTYRGSLYDYWYSNVTAVGGVPAAAASSLTLDSGYGAGAAGLAQRMSDHTATLLRIL